jgi:hypothetical protein
MALQPHRMKRKKHQRGLTILYARTPTLGLVDKDLKHFPCIICSKLHFCFPCVIICIIVFSGQTCINSVLIYYLPQVELVILPRSIINENPPEQENQPPPPPPPPQNQESEEEQNEEEEQEVSYFII